MKKKVIKFNENDIENLVKRIIKEDHEDYVSQDPNQIELPFEDDETDEYDEQEDDNSNRRFEISLCIEEYIVDENGDYVETDGIDECEVLEVSSDPDYINDLYDSYMESLREHEYKGIYK